MKLSLSEHIQRSKEAVAANKAKGNKHAELFATMYTQPSRFIEEILQNTEDAYARKNEDNSANTIRFKLFSDKVEIHHNGKDFDENDLMSITTFANTTKKTNSEVNLIGKFGIGFKSVFSITDFPEIHCGKYHYRITDFEVLTACESKQADEGFHTLIELPFKGKELAECFAVVRQGLNELNGFHLLFLNKLNRIEVYEAKNLLISLERKSVRLRKNIDKRIIIHNTSLTVFSEKSEIYLVHSTEGRYQKKLPELAFKVSELRNTYSFLPIPDAPLFVYFPLKMNSGLNFLIHAPFTTNPLRDFALFDLESCPENIQLLNEAVRSYVSSLDEFKKVHFYSVDLLGRLLITLPETESSDRQKSIIQKKFSIAFGEFLTSGDNLPIGGNKFSSVEKVVIPENISVHQLLSDVDLGKLFQKRCFIDAKICSENMTKFKNYLSNVLSIKIVDAESFAFRIRVTPGFLEKKSIKWLKDFYKYVHSHQKLWDVQHAGLYYSLRTAPFILTEENSFVAAYDNDNNPKVFLPGRKKEKLTVVNHKLMDDENCVTFFNDFGIHLPEAFDDVIHNTLPQFFQNSDEVDRDYYNKLKKILSVFSEASQNKKKILTDLLANTAFIWSEDCSGNMSFRKPAEVYIKNGVLVNYFKSRPEVYFIPSLLYTKITGKYPDLSKAFFTDLGLTDIPRIQYNTDKIISIDGFEDFIANMDFERSKAFVKIICNAPENYLKGDVLLYLRKQRWVYNKSGQIVAPEAIMISDISGSYKFDQTEKIRFQILLGMTSGKPFPDEHIIPWQAQLKPEEIDVRQFSSLNSSAIPFDEDMGLISQFQTSLSFPDSGEVELREYSQSDIYAIHKWAGDFLLRILRIDFPEPEYEVETSFLADFVIYKNGEICSYIFVSGKTDLMNQFHSDISQFVNICKLQDSKSNTFLYCINSVGTSGVSISIFQNPFELIIQNKFRLSGRIRMTPE